MAQFSKPTFRGLLVPDERVSVTNISAADSTYNQAGPKPGIPTPQADTDLNLEASGTQSANKQLRIATHRGGHPGRGGATFRWKGENDSATSWRGVWPANTMSGWSTTRTVDPGASDGRRAALDSDCVFMENGKIGVVYAEEHYTAGASNYRVAFYTVDKEGTVSADTIIYSSLSDNEGLHPAIVRLPSGRLMLYHYLEATNDTCQVQSWMSDDDGGTWIITNTSTLDTSVDIQAAAAGYDLDTRPSAKMRVAYSGGQMLMVISARSNDTSTGSYQDAIIQYASSNQGQSFQHVGTTSFTVSATQAECVASSNGFEVFYVGGTAGADAVIRKSLASAFIPIENATEVNGPGVLQSGNWAPGGIALRVNTDAEISACIGDDGILYVIARGRQVSPSALASSILSGIRMCMDVSGGADRNNFYKLLGQGASGAASSAANAGTIYFGEASADYPRYFGFVPAWGRLHIFHNHSASTATRDKAMGWMQLGGYNSVTLGAYNDDGSLARRVCWSINYLPLEVPNNFPGWTTATAGTNSASVNSGYLHLATTAGKVIYYKAPTGTIAEGMIAHFGVRYVSSHLPGVDQIFARFQAADGSDKHTLDVYIRDGNIDVQDNNGGAVLGTLAMDTKTIGVEILVFFRSGKATVYARQRDNKADEAWTAICSNATVSDSGSGSMEIRFGHKASTTAASQWHFFNYVSDEFAGGTPYSTGFTNPDDLSGQPFNSIGSTWVDDGVRIRGIDGPTVPSDTWNIDTRYEYPISNVLTASEPSPAKEWRSTDESAQTIAFSFSGVNRYSELGLYLDGINFRTATLAGYNGAAWVTLASVDSATGQTTLAYSQGGTTLGVNAAATTSPGRYFELNELVGGSVRVNPSSGADFTRKITDSGAGVWTEQAGHVRANVEMESTPIVIATTGTLDIWSPRIFIAMHNVPSVYKKYRLVIDASQNTADGYYKIGQMVLGSLSLFSQDYSWGRSMSTEPGTELVTYRDGSRSSFKRSSNRRSVSFGWGEGVDVTGTQGATPTADYLLATSTSGALPIGYRGDVPSLLNQLNAYTAGSNIPVVYCPNIAAGSTGQDVKTIQGLSNIYGRIISGISTDSIVGEEDDGIAGEVLRISNVQIEEEL
tara:strand:+ start:1293 stop:4649 length:3357 start_codon:yes stop_codon:yes gene_type:complete